MNIKFVKIKNPLVREKVVVTSYENNIVYPTNEKDKFFNGLIYDYYNEKYINKY